MKSGIAIPDINREFLKGTAWMGAAAFAAGCQLVKPIADARIPILLVYGGVDNVLDPRLSSELFIPRFKTAGGEIKVIYRALYGHHPHGFEVGETVVQDFFCGH